MVGLAGACKPGGSNYLAVDSGIGAADPSGDGADAGEPSSGVILRVHRAAQTTALRTSSTGLPTAPGASYWTTDLEIENRTDLDLELVPTLFALETEGGLEYTAGAETALVESGCPANAKLVSHESTRCVVVFSVPMRETPTRIRYQYPGLDAAQANVEPIACTKCGKDCLDVTGDDPDHCGGCQIEVGPAGTCKGGVPVCNPGMTACNGRCTDLKRDPNHCGACGDAVKPGEMTCVNGVRVCTNTSDERIACGASCVYAADSAHCGTCNRVCPTGHDCWKKLGSVAPNDYWCRGESQERKSCAQICGALACTKTEAKFRCDGTTWVVTTPRCNSTPPPSEADTTGRTCTFESIECECQ